MKYSICPTADFFEIQTTGKVSAQEYIDLLDALVNHEQWQPGTPILSDETALVTDHLGVDDVKAIAGACGARSELFGPSKIAIIARSDLVFGLNRMWEVFAEDQWHAEVQVFRSRSEALKWLGV